MPAMAARMSAQRQAVGSTDSEYVLPAFGGETALKLNKIPARNFFGPAFLTNGANGCLIDKMESLDAAAVKLVRAGDRDAFRPIVERYSDMLFRLAYRITNNEADAEEVVQETFLRAYRKLDSFNGRSSVSTWLFRIAANCSLDLLDRRKTQPQLLVRHADEDESSPEEHVPSKQPNPERMAYNAEMQANIATALESLTSVERTAFVLRHVEGCSVEEIAAALNVRAGAARHSVFRAVEKMRKFLAPAMRPVG
jgi:RNA polymerase sigma-70 factor (ECF subfamily)